jgi:hypothetical protein
MEVPTIYKIFGEQTDSSVVWQDQRTSLLRTHQLTQLVSGAANDPILWHVGAATERAQRSGVAASLSALVLMAGSSDIREHIRDVEKNNIPLPGGAAGAVMDLSQDVDKIRYILDYYDTLTQPSDDKDTKLLLQRDEIKYESTGKSNLTKDVKALFQKFKAVELEMQDHVKLGSFQAISKCSKILAKSIPALRTVINSLPLSTRIYSFDQFCKQGCF